MKKYIIMFALTAAFSSCCNGKEEMKYYLQHYEGPRIFLLSYPRSGNTWLRYCLEFLTHRPSFMPGKLEHGIIKMRDVCLICEPNFEFDMTKEPIAKAHSRKELIKHNNHPENKLIFLLRNPKEAIMRHKHSLITFALLQGDEKEKWGRWFEHVKHTLYVAPIYFDNLAIYDSWDADKRFLIYYEDLLLHPREELARILNFLQEPLMHLDTFMEEYDKHKKTCLALYKESASKGNDLLFHSKKTDSVYRKSVDEWIVQLYLEWWNKYLKHRYAEEILNYP